MEPEFTPDIGIAPSFDVGPAIDEIIRWVGSYLPWIPFLIKNFTGIVLGISIPLSIFFFIVIIYCVEQLKRIRAAEEKKYDLKVEPAYEEVVDQGNIAMAAKWQSVKDHMASENPNDWRQAIMDADIILDDLLTKMGYKGESIGEKLKRVEKGDFESIDDAWEAHKVRNRIAHEGTAFDLNLHDAQKAIAHYRRVFEEFYYI